MEQESFQEAVWDEKNQIIKATVIGNFDEKEAEIHVDKITEIKAQFPDKEIRLFVDLNKAGIPSSKARKIVVDKIFKDPDIKKIANLFSSVLIKTINNFLVKASGQDGNKMKAFSSEQEALKWLKE